MTPREVLTVLAYAGGIDPRVRRNDPDETRLQVDAWYAQLRDVPAGDARAAVHAHYARSGVDALMPADVRSRVAATRSDRIQRAELDPPAGLDPDDTAAYRAWMLASLRAVADGRPLPARPVLGARPVGELVAAVSEARGLPSRARERRDRTLSQPRNRPQRTPAPAGPPVTVCHKCACDIPVPDGWDPANPSSPALFCDRCQAERRTA
jgi:hypothetical protein